MKRPHPDDQVLRNYGIDYAKSSDADCQVCLVKILKAETRIKKLANTETQWRHVDCFAQPRGDLGLTFAADLLSGFGDLQLEDMRTVLRTVKPGTMFGSLTEKLRTPEWE